MSGSSTWEEWEKHKAREAFDNIKFDMLLEKDQNEVLKLAREHLEHKQRKVVEKFGVVGTGKTNHWLDNALTKVATQGENAQWTIVYHPDLICADALIPSSEELEKLIQVYGLSMDAVYFDESSILNNPEEDKPKKKKNMRDDVRSFLNKGRKW